MCGASCVVELAVEVGVDRVEHLGARGVVRVAAAHDPSVPLSAVGAAGTSPRSRA